MKFGRITIKLSQWAKDKIANIAETAMIAGALILMPAMLLVIGVVMHVYFGK